MKVKSIIIELEPDAAIEVKHATILEYKDGTWIVNGPMFPRISGALLEIVILLKGQK